MGEGEWNGKWERGNGMVNGRGGTGLAGQTSTYS